MTRKILAALVSVILFTAVDCKDEPTKPPITEQPQDTTSHNFVVTRIDTLGDLFSTAFCVDIVDENNIWVGGEFTKGIDSINSHTDSNYNAVHWDGSKWNMLRIPMYGWNNTGPSPEALGGIKVFSDSSVFVVAKNDNSVAWWNGRKWTSTYVNDAVVSPHFWARSPDDIYFVSTQGRATHFNGQIFTMMTTGITTNGVLTDIWGDENSVYTLGSSNDMKENAILYSRNTSDWTIMNRYSIDTKNPSPPNKYMGRLNSIYKSNKISKLWVLGGEDNGSLYQITSVSLFSAKEFFKIPESFYPLLVRGNSDNDLFLFGGHGEILHYNGSSWKFISNDSLGLHVVSGVVKGNTIVLVGESWNFLGRGMVVILQR